MAKLQTATKSTEFYISGVLAAALGAIQVKSTSHRNVISGYGARNTIGVTLRDVQKLEPVLVAALEAGADAFVLKRAIATDLLATVDALRRGRSQGAFTDEGSPTVIAKG